MPSSSDKERGLLKTIVSDPWRKLAAIALAFVLWHLLDDRITDEREPVLALTVADNADDPGDKDTLLVVVDPSRYFVDGFEDLLTGEEIEHVQLKLRGERSVIKDFDDEQSGFRVTPSLDNLGDSGKATEFSVEDVRAVDKRLNDLIVGMSPATVRVTLSKHTRRDVPLNPQIVEITAPPEVEARLMRDAAVFSSKAVWVMGPANQIEALQSMPRVFMVDISNVLPSDTEVTGTLRLMRNPRLEKLRFADSESVTVTVPLRIPFQSYTVEVPYMLDQLALPPEVRGQFRAIESSAEIEVEVSHNLELTLAPMKEDELHEWMWRHARLWVCLPPDATENDIFTPQFLIVGERYERDLDYRVVDLKPLRIQRRP